VQIWLLKTDYLFPFLHECMSRKRVSPRNPFSVRYSTDLVLGGQGWLTRIGHSLTQTEVNPVIIQITNQIGIKNYAT